jgi:hypothetical protein
MDEKEALQWKLSTYQEHLKALQLDAILTQQNIVATQKEIAELDKPVTNNPDKKKE